MDGFSLVLIFALLGSVAALIGASLHAAFATRRAAFLLVVLAVLWPFVVNVSIGILLYGEDEPVDWSLLGPVSEAARLTLVALSLLLLYRLRGAR